MEQRYTTAKTLPGTRSYHNFTPISDTKIGTVYEYELQSVCMFGI